MQLTDKVLLPATISYTGSEQQSTSDDATQFTDVLDTTQSTGIQFTGVDDACPTAEAGHNEASNVAMSAVIEDDAGHDKMKNTDVCSVAVDSTAYPLTTSGCMEVNSPYSASHHAGQSTLDTAGGISVMTMSLVNFPSECIGDGAEMVSASSSTVLQPQPTAVHIDGTFLRTADTNVVSTDLGACGDGHYTCEPESTSLICNAVLDDGGCSEAQKPTEWTRYFVCSNVILLIRCLI